MPTLLLMRHAKSDWDAEYGTDHDRPINDRGRSSARLIGRVLSEEGLAPEVVISSTAVRARTTAELAIEAGEWGAELVLDRALYESGPQGVLAAGAKTLPEIGRLMLVGHQPTWSMLVALLTGERAEMKTATVSVIDLAFDSWADLPGSSGTLARVIEPKSFDKTL